MHVSSFRFFRAIHGTERNGINYCSRNAPQLLHCQQQTTILPRPRVATTFIEWVGRYSRSVGRWYMFVCWECSAVQFFFHLGDVLPNILRHSQSSLFSECDKIKSLLRNRGDKICFCSCFCRQISPRRRGWRSGYLLGSLSSSWVAHLVLQMSVNRKVQDSEVREIRRSIRIFCVLLLRGDSSNTYIEGICKVLWDMGPSSVQEVWQTK